ncbi:MAG: hypothetical protein ACRDJN_16950 [Chloroflexota bacterium]
MRFRQSGWSNDRFLLEYTVDEWATASPLAVYDWSNPPPTSLTTITFAGLETDLNVPIDTPTKANALQVRFRGLSWSGIGAETITVSVDQVRLTVRGTPP